VPTASDDVVATGTSGNLTITAAALARSVDLTGYTNTLTHNSGFTWTIGTSTANGTKALLFPTSGWTYTLGSATSSAISFISTVASTTQTVDFGGYTVGNVSFSAATTSGYQLQSNTTSSGTITLTQGTLNTNAKTITSTNFTANNTNTKTLTMTNTSWTLTANAPWVVNATGTTLNASGSTITPTIATNTPVLFTGGGFVYGALTITAPGSGHVFQIDGGNTFSTLTTTNANAYAWTLKFTSATTTTITTWAVNGNSGHNLTVESTTANSRAIVSLTNIPTATYVTFQDLAVIGAGIPVNATSNCTNNGNNSGIQFNASYDIIQNSNGTGATSGTATSGALATTTGHTLVIIVNESAGVGNTWTITDTASNTWTQAVTQASASDKCDIWYAKNITGNAAHTVTATSSSSLTNVAIVVMECVGLDLSAPLDKTVSATGVLSNPAPGTTATLSQAQEIVIAGYVSTDTTLTDYTKTTGYNWVEYPFVATTNTALSQYKTVNATTAVTAALTDGTNATWAAVLTTWKYTASTGAHSFLLMGVGN
jgi:hypothetical protein